VLLVETRIWQFRKSVNPFDPESGGSFGDKQLNRPCGLSPLNGVNALFGSVDKNVAVPVPSARAGAGDEPKSQLLVGDQPAIVWSTPSHCSTDTNEPGAKPVAITVNATGFPDASPGTTNGDPDGCVIDANATPTRPTRPTTAPTATTATRRLRTRITRVPSRQLEVALIHARVHRDDQSMLGFFSARSRIVHR